MLDGLPCSVTGLIPYNATMMTLLSLAIDLVIRFIYYNHIIKGVVLLSGWDMEKAACRYICFEKRGDYMFREMRRKKQALPIDECKVILERGTSGILAVAGDDDYPYAVPLSYVYYEGKLIFHCAKAGHKMDAIRRNPKVSFCVIDEDQIVPSEYTSYFRSVVTFGKIRMIEDEKEKWDAINHLAIKYAPGDTEDGRRMAIEKDWKPLCVLEMAIDHMTGKESIELVNQSKAACSGGIA